MKKGQKAPSEYIKNLTKIVIPPKNQMFHVKIINEHSPRWVKDDKTDNQSSVFFSDGDIYDG